MNKIGACATIGAALQASLEDIAVDDRSKAWDLKKTTGEYSKNDVKSFKAIVKEHGMAAQDRRCAWCTLQIGDAGNRSAHRDHIAPKGLYKQWTFLPLNLVMSCEFCNGFERKSSKDTVEVEADNYCDCNFRIVHPYLDEPEKHIEFHDFEGTPGVIMKSCSDKGTWTINALRLDSPEMTELRMKERIFEAAVAELPEDYADLLKRATGRITENDQ